MKRGELQGGADAVRARILVVDDDERNRRLLRRWLEGEHDVVEADDGPAALAVVEREPVDVIVLDVMLPGLNGYDVCREVRRRQGDGPSVPIVLVTALGEQDDRNEGLSAGADDFLTKPCDRTELRLRVAAFVRARRAEQLVRRQLAELTQLAALKDDLVALVVHDLRVPLSGTTGLLRIVRDGIADPVLRADVDAALVAAARASATAEELLEVRLLEEGELVRAHAAVDPGALVREAIRNLEAAARARGISFQVVAPDGGALDLDPRLVRRAVENLLSNALRYSPDGGEIAVAARRAGAFLELEVADRGPGVPALLRDAVFEKFGVVDARRDQARRGFGLGLYLVRLVARAHDGTASVEDRPGGGALFRLRLAAVPAPISAVVDR